MMGDLVDGYSTYPLQMSNHWNTPTQPGKSQTAVFRASCFTAKPLKIVHEKLGSECVSV